MKQAPYIKHLAILTLCFSLFGGCGKKPQPPMGPAKIKVMASSYVPYTLANQILAGAADVSLIVPPGMEPHHFEPSAQTAMDAQNTDILFYLNDMAEPWAFKLAPFNSVALSAKISPSHHTWMDFDNALYMAEAAASAAANKKQTLEPIIFKNVLNLQNEIEMLKRLYAKGLANCQTNKIYHIGHNAFGPLARKYNLEFIPLTGADFEGEPSPKNLAAMIKQIKANDIKYIFTEDAVNTKLADTIAQETNAKILKLYTIEFVTKEQLAAQTSYRQFMTQNLQSLMQGLGCN